VQVEIKTKSCNLLTQKHVDIEQVSSFFQYFAVIMIPFVYMNAMLATGVYN
jgi:hypothetical protein